MKAILLVAIALLFAAEVNAAETFPLNKAIPDRTIVCVNKDAAIALAEAIVYPVMAQQLYKNYMDNSQCFNVEGMMTYTKKVHTTAKKWFVYEMKFGQTTGWVPTDMVSAGTDI